MTQLRFYRLALAVSLALNVVLIAAVALYLHFEGMLGVIEEAVGFFG